MVSNIISKDEQSHSLNHTFIAWQNIKTKYMDAIILIRQGNEYYTFGSDAEVVSIMLGIEPERENERRITCHMPHYRTDTLLHNIVKAGYRVALCEPLFFNHNT